MKKYLFLMYTLFSIQPSHAQTINATPSYLAEQKKTSVVAYANGNTTTKDFAAYQQIVVTRLITKSQGFSLVSSFLSDQSKLSKEIINIIFMEGGAILIYYADEIKKFVADFDPIPFGKYSKKCRVIQIL